MAQAYVKLYDTGDTYRILETVEFYGLSSPRHTYMYFGTGDTYKLIGTGDTFRPFDTWDI
jgi:hypothetical protein